jgi:hydrogenase maturation protein HypF
MALAYLEDAGLSDPRLERRTPTVARRAAQTMLERRFNTPLTSSAGRLFDAVAALAGVRDRVSFEGQAAMELEWLAEGLAPDRAYPFDLEETVEEDTRRITLAVDTRPLVRGVARDASQGVDAARIARRFHSTMVELVVTVCGRLRQATGLDRVVLSGGVFMNALLTCEASAGLTRAGLRVYRHQQVPPNDGGLSLGQLAIAVQQLALEPARQAVVRGRTRCREKRGGSNGA